MVDCPFGFPITPPPPKKKKKKKKEKGTAPSKKGNGHQKVKSGHPFLDCPGKENSKRKRTNLGGSPPVQSDVRGWWARDRSTDPSSARKYIYIYVYVYVCIYIYMVYLLVILL